MEDNKTKEEILREAEAILSELKSGSYEDWVNRVAKRLASYSQQSTKQLQDRVKELEDGINEIIKRSNTGKNIPEIDSSVASYARTLVNTKS